MKWVSGVVAGSGLDDTVCDIYAPRFLTKLAIVKCRTTDARDALQALFRSQQKKLDGDTVVAMAGRKRGEGGMPTWKRRLFAMQDEVRKAVRGTGHVAAVDVCTSRGELYLNNARVMQVSREGLMNTVTGGAETIAWWFGTNGAAKMDACWQAALGADGCGQ